jgi:hypothetical protein
MVLLYHLYPQTEKTPKLSKKDRLNALAEEKNNER